MKYLPWDRLQMTTSIHNHAPVRKTELVYPLYRGFHSSFAHVPEYHRNLGVYTADHADKVELLENFIKDNDPVQRFATVALFDIPGTLADDGNRLEALGAGFEYHEYRADFATLLADLLAHRDQVRLDTHAAGMAQSYHRHVYTVIFHVDTQIARQIRAVPKVQAAFQELLLHSTDENLNFVMLTDGVFMQHRKFFDLFDQEVYLGEENMDFALEFFDTLDEGNISMMQQHVGWGRRRLSTRLTALHPRKYTESQWLQERNAAIAAEEEAYAAFLASLRDD